MGILVVNGQVKRTQDEDIQSNILEIVGTNVQSTYITCPADPSATLGIKLPFLVMIVKNVKKYFTFEIQVLDDKNVRRRFRASNFQVCKSSLNSNAQFHLFGNSLPNCSIVLSISFLIRTLYIEISDEL